MQFSSKLVAANAGEVTLGVFSPKTEHRTEPKPNQKVGNSVFQFGFGFQFCAVRCSASASVSMPYQTEVPRNRETLVRQAKAVSAERQPTRHRPTAHQPTTASPPRHPAPAPLHFPASNRVAPHVRTQSPALSLLTLTLRRRGRRLAAHPAGQGARRPAAAAPPSTVVKLLNHGRKNRAVLQCKSLVLLVLA